VTAARPVRPRPEQRSTGQACVFGEHGPDATAVELGSGIADGGCLPAPD
jgi:hypothetical protein